MATGRISCAKETIHLEALDVRTMKESDDKGYDLIGWDAEPVTEALFVCV